MPSALQSIVDWAENELAAWQSDAVRRILTQDELDESDEKELLEMLKNRHNLSNPQNPPPKPQPIKKGFISGVPQTPVKVAIKAMKIDCNVNAIPDGSSLPFGHEGLTVIYGENGSGKSGYTRVMKRACSARDTKESILPNAFTRARPGSAKACFKVSINNGSDQEILWEDGQEADSILSNICVFDSKCARVIVDDNNEITYLPYGAHVFEGLVTLLKSIRSKLETERPTPKKLDYPDVPATTEAGEFIAGISHKTSSEEINKSLRWVSENEKKLTELNKRIADAEAHDPLQQAQRIRNLKARLIQLRSICVAIEDGLSELEAQNLRMAIESLKTSEKALSIISQESLMKEPLPGAGEAAWQKLYNAAKYYSIEKAYPSQDFPVVESDSRCVLCMQPLQVDGKNRMLRFKSFMDNTTKKEVENANDNLKKLNKSLQELIIPDTDIYKDVLDEIRTRAPQFAGHLKEFFILANERAASMIKSAEDKEVQSFPDLKPIRFECLDMVANDLEKEAKKIEKTADPDTLVKMQTERNELKARKLLRERKKQIQEYIEQIKTAQKYDKCIAETQFKTITNKAKKIIVKSLTPHLQKALKNELNALNASHLQLNLKPTGREGEARHRMELLGAQCSSKIKLTEILSEGEQHVVAIAGFLAELQIGNTQSPIVFDDPVCSLDHLYREKIAYRLAKEAAIRQVLVFTHDIAFLLELKAKAGELGGIYFLPQTVLKLANVPGKCMDGLPWHAMAVKERLAYLNTQVDALHSLYKSDSQKYNREAGYLYGLLRETWEAVIEEVLFYGTIIRHAGEVQTLRLSYVTVTDEDYRTIHLGMSKCSKWMFGHDKSQAIDVNRLAPEEIKQDIASLKTFTKTVHGRREEIRKQRSETLHPKKPSIG